MAQTFEQSDRELELWRKLVDNQSGPYTADKTDDSLTLLRKYVGNDAYLRNNGLIGGGGGSGAGVDVAITSLAELAEVDTTTITPGEIGSVKLFILAADGSYQVWQLRASTAATETGAVQRPDDYHASTNAKVWFKCN